MKFVASDLEAEHQDRLRKQTGKPFSDRIKEYLKESERNNQNSWMVKANQRNK